MAAAKVGSVLVEACENYQKQSYRNRCRIYAAGGPETLQIPVCHTDSRLIRDIRIDYSREWLHQHRYAIVSAYRSSPFFEYYWDDIETILNSRPEFLFDLNLKLTECISSLMNLRVDFGTTTEFLIPSEPAASNDLRYAIHPKKGSESSLFTFREYYQVFSAKHGFIPDLSILDLLFHEGPQASYFLTADSAPAL